MGKIIPIKGKVTYLDIPVEKVLDSAKDQLEDVVLLGWHKKGGHLYFASTFADCGEMLWLLEHAKNALMKMGKDE